jgi:GNAT superfamily N-acetyltransferase
MLEFRLCSVNEQPAAALVAAMRTDIAALYDGFDLAGPDMPKAGPGELGPPGGTFVVGFEDDAAVCCGAIKRLPDGACEIKRMFVVESARGRGVARALLEELERRARDLGYEIVRLDTGPRQTRAQRMYERAGYVAIENLNANRSRASSAKSGCSAGGPRMTWPPDAAAARPGSRRRGAVAGRAA